MAMMAMFIKLGHRLNEIHEFFKRGKDKAFEPVVRLLPRWLTANQVTLFRSIIVLIWLPFAILRPCWWQISIFFIAGFFDLLDGAIARFKNQITYFGKYFDILSDRFNHLVLWLVVLGAVDYQLMILKLFIGWELIISLYLIIEYFAKSNKLIYIRNLSQFCVRITLWIGLVYEISYFI